MALITQATYELDINENDINVSVQPGDLIYRTCLSTYALSSGVSTGSTKLLGTVTKAQMQTNYQGNLVLVIGFNYSSFAGNSTPAVALSDIPGSTLYTSTTCEKFFLTFKKDCAANASSLLGYYASTTFINTDYNNPAELFAVSSEVTISSK